jgi:TetR/AcrR family transcriptional regulator
MEEWAGYMARKTKLTAAAKERVAPSRQSRGAPRPKKRRKQQRALNTKEAIMNAALAEFAEKGFDGASIRNIAERTGLQHPLITYHYRTKDLLWEAVAEYAFGRIRALWDAEVISNPKLTAVERLQEEYRTFLAFTLEHPDFHHFMLRESRPLNPRLPWLTSKMINPLLNRLIPQIRAAQASGELPQGDPALIHYLLIGATSVLSSLGAEIREATGLSPNSPTVIETFWSLIEQTVFGGFHRRKRN